METLYFQELERLQSERSRIWHEIEQLPDMRPGSLTMARPKCGKSNCHCAKEGDPGHGPVYFLIRRVGHKNITRSVPLAVLDTVRQQVETHHKYEDLSRQYVEISGQISDLKMKQVRESASGETPQTAGKKNSKISSFTVLRRNSPTSWERAPTALSISRPWRRAVARPP